MQNWTGLALRFRYNLELPAQIEFIIPDCRSTTPPRTMWVLRKKKANCFWFLWTNPSLLGGGGVHCHWRNVGSAKEIQRERVLEGSRALQLHGSAIHWGTMSLPARHA